VLPLVYVRLCSHPMMQIFRGARRGDSEDEHFLNMLQVDTSITPITNKKLTDVNGATHTLISRQQAAMAAQGGAANAAGMLEQSSLDSHSTTFIQPKDVDPSSTSENSQCRCRISRAAFCRTLKSCQCGRYFLEVTRACSQYLSRAFCSRR
jgi:hypothetical protein